MSVYLSRLARWCFRRRRIVLGVWLVILVVAIAIGKLSGGTTTNAFSIPGTESQSATSVLLAKLPAAAGGSTQVVFSTGHGEIASSSDEAAIEKALAKLRSLPQVVSVTNPYQVKTISADSDVALATVSYAVAAGNVKTSTINGLGPAVRTARAAGLEIEFSGAVYPNSGRSDVPEVIGLLVALVILVITFGSFLAGGLPIATALVGVIISLMGMTALASVTTIASASTSLGTMLGISCGIDYGLFILSRHRQHLLAGEDPEAAVGRAAGTAGSSVVFAGLSVIIALCGLSVVGIPFLTTMGLAAAGSVLLALLLALTLLPATLGFAGRRAGRFSHLRLLHRVRPATLVAVERPKDLAGTRWATWVVRHRIPVVIACVLGLAAMAIPVLSMDLGLPNAGSRPTSDTSRRAYDLTTKHFGAGYNGTLTIVAQNDSTTAQAQMLATTLGKLDGVASARVSTVANGIGLISVVPTTGPNSTATENLVHRIRDNRAAIEGTGGSHILVGGTTATNIDISAKLGAALPIFLITVAVLAFLLLTFAFRTILVAIKSILGFMLSVGAALGAQVAVFQWGWLGSVFGIESSQTLSFLPVILLAIVFGLSSDYEVFVVSRIKEYFTKHGDAHQAVIIGTGQSARVVTAAALIMASVFASFMFTSDPIIKSIGFSFSIGVLIDAFVVRLTLVPAVMAIVGARIWHHPAWYERYIPDPDIEGERLAYAADSSPTTEPQMAGRAEP